MTTKHTPTTPLPFDTPQYWFDLAASERAFAKDKRSARYGSVESIRVHENNAAEYEARGNALLRELGE